MVASHLVTDQKIKRKTLFKNRIKLSKKNYWSMRQNKKSKICRQRLWWRVNQEQGNQTRLEMQSIQQRSCLQWLCILAVKRIWIKEHILFLRQTEKKVGKVVCSDLTPVYRKNQENPRPELVISQAFPWINCY